MIDRRIPPCYNCGAWDDEREGCTMPAPDRQYACPIEDEEGKGGKTMTEYRLAPCPFCGSKTAPTVMDQNQALWTDPDFDGDLRIVVCCAATKGGCGSSTGFCDDDEKAVAAWNRRKY